MGLLLLIHLLLALGCVIGPCNDMHYLVAFHFCNNLAEKEINGCFTLTVFLLALLIVFGAQYLFLTVSWVGLQCVNFVAFPGHTYLFLRYNTHDCFFSFLFHLPYYHNHYSLTLVMILFNCHFLVTSTETLCSHTIITQAIPSTLVNTTAAKFSMGTSVSCNAISLSVSQMSLEYPQYNSNVPRLNLKSV